MEPRRPHCFIRTWSHPVCDQENGHPLLLVTYRLALETFAPYAEYDLVYYDPTAQYRVRRIVMGEATLQVQLRREYEVPMRSHKMVTHFEASRINHNFLVIIIGVVYSLTPTDLRIDFPWTGRHDMWSEHVDFIRHAQCRTSSDSVLAIQFSSFALTDADDYSFTCFAPLLF